MFLLLSQVISDAGWSHFTNFSCFIAIVLLLVSPVATHTLCTCPETAFTANMTEGFGPQIMEEFYLADKNFLAGNSISIADLLYSCELDEMRLLDGVEKVSCPTPLCVHALCQTTSKLCLHSPSAVLSSMQSCAAQ